MGLSLLQSRGTSCFGVAMAQPNICHNRRWGWRLAARPRRVRAGTSPRHPHPDTHSACFIHPSLSGLLTFSSMHQDSQFLPLNVPPRYLHVSLSGYSDPLLLLLREGFSGHNPYLCLVQVTFPTHVDPTLKIGLYC